MGLVLRRSGDLVGSGALLVAQMVANPKSHIMFTVGDILGLMGDAEHIAAAEQLMRPQEEHRRSIERGVAGVPHSTPA